jgi:hypothetical protein
MVRSYSGAPNDNWSDENLSDLSQVHGSDFEVVDTGELIY